MLLMLLLMILTLTEYFEDLSKSGAQGKRRDAVQASTHEKLRTLTAHAAALLQSCGEEAPKWATSGTLELCGQLNEQLSSLVQKVGESMFVLDEADEMLDIGFQVRFRSPFGHVFSAVSVTNLVTVLVTVLATHLLKTHSRRNLVRRRTLTRFWRQRPPSIPILRRSRSCCGRPRCRAGWRALLTST